MTKDQIHKIGLEALELYQDSRMLLDEFFILAEWHNKYYIGGNTLEIGAYKGMTSFVFAALMNEYKERAKWSKHYVVDAFGEVEDNWGYEEYTEDMLVRNVGRFGELLHTCKSKSLDYPSTDLVINKDFDMVFIDGDHRYPIVYLELCLVDGVTKHITGHDYGHIGVTKSVDRFCDERGYRINKPQDKLGMFEIIK